MSPPGTTLTTWRKLAAAILIIYDGTGLESAACEGAKVGLFLF